MFEKVFHWIKDNCILLTIFVSVALLIFAHSYFFGAYIWPDSTSYLRAAQSLRDGYGFRDNAAAGDYSRYFSVWPIGYPAMIAFVSIITNTEIYLASKILSIVILLIVFIMLYVRFKKTAWLYGFIAINLGFLNIFYYTLSEQPFILGLIWLSFMVTDILESKRIKYSLYISIGLASLFLFITRYIGAFSIGIIGLTAIYHLVIGISKKRIENIKSALLLLTTAGIVAGFMILYLFLNYKYSGFVTGGARNPISENPFVLFLQLCIAQINEMQNVFGVFFRVSTGMACILYMICAVICFRFLYIKRGSFCIYIPKPAFSFLSIGLLYWLSIVIMRFSFRFDDFSFRLLFPASALFTIGVIEIIEKYHSELIEKITREGGGKKYILAVIIVVSLLSTLARPLYNAVFEPDMNVGYTKLRSGILNELQNVPAHSLVIVTNLVHREYYVNFMRIDLLYMWNQLSSPESTDKLLASIEQYKDVYLYTDWNSVSDEVKEVINSRYNGSLGFEKKLIRIK